MTDAASADEWRKRQDLGFQTRPESSIRLHSSAETAKHAHVKLALARELQQRRGPNRWDTEVRLSDGSGRVDVLDYGPVGEPPAVYEVETGLTRQAKLDKIAQYSGDTLPEERIYFLDPTEAPDSIPELEEWVRTEAVG